VSEPTKQEVNEVLDKLEPERWQSDAEKLDLPLVSVRDSGAPRLDVDEAIRRTTPTYTKEKR